MIGLAAGTRIWIAAGFTDLRKGFTGLSGMCRPHFRKIHSRVMSSCFVDGAAI
jgi:hypothetical protein